MNLGDIIFKVIDYRGEEVTFTKKKWEEKRKMHPELNNAKILKNIEKALICPDEVWEDYSNKKNKSCYYKKYSQFTFIKVVIWNKNPCSVITAYRIDKVKEKNYPDLKQIK
jgi:hypothetical protein